MKNLYAKIKPILTAYDYLPRWFDLLLVAALVTCTCFYNFIWADLNQKPPFSDASTHAYQSLVFHNTIHSTNTIAQSIFHFLTFRNHYPPLSFQVNELGYLLMGKDKMAPIVGMFPFIALMGYSMYFLGRHVGGRLGGLCAAVIACTSPAVLEYTRVPFIDFQLAAVTAFGLCTLYLGERFTNTKLSITCGVALALGMLTKWTYPIFVAIPLVSIAISVLWHTSKSEYKKGCKILALIIPLLVGQYFIFFSGITAPTDQIPSWMILSLWLVLLVAIIAAVRWWCGKEAFCPFENMSLCLLALIMLTGPWYNHNIDRIMHKVAYQAGVDVPFQTVLFNNIIVQNTWVYCALALVPLGFIIGLCQRSNRRLVIELLLTWGLVLVVLSNAPFDPRYILPLITHTTIIGMCSFSVLQILGLIPLAIFSYVGFIQLSFHLLDKPPQWYTMKEMLASNPPVCFPLPCYPEYPSYYIYPYKELIDSLSLTYRKDGVCWICLIIGATSSESNVIPPRSLLYYALLSNKNIDVVAPLIDEHIQDLGTKELDGANFAIMYHDRNSSAYVPERFYEPDEPQTREEIIEATQNASKYFPKTIKTKQIFRFGVDTIIELMETPGKRPKHQHDIKQ